MGHHDIDAWGARLCVADFAPKSPWNAQVIPFDLAGEEGGADVARVRATLARSMLIARSVAPLWAAAGALLL